MLKIFILLVAITSQLQLFNSPVYAEELPKCTSPTANVIPDDHPAPPRGTDRKATFEVNVGNINTYTKWRMEFVCGTSHLTVDANEDYIGNKIDYKLDKTDKLNDPNPCEFTEGLHTIKVIGVNQANQETPYCIASYTITSTLRHQESLCILDITPQNNIITDTKLTVRVTGLPTADPYQTSTKLFYRLYVDDEPVSVPFSQSYTGEIDAKYMGVNRTHVVYIKKSNNDGRKDGATLSVCRASYTVGTEDKPGGVIISGAGPTQSSGAPCTEQDIKDGKCTSGGGDPCDTQDNRGPAFKTAIGCIHTNPAEFVKDLLKFVLGIGGGLAFLMMLLGAFQMLTSAGNPDTLNAGRDRLTSAVIGLLFVIFSILLMQIIGVDILQIPGFKKPVG